MNDSNNYIQKYEQEEHYSYAYIIKHLLEKNILEKLITNINDTKTITNTRCLSKTKKGYLTGNEQFLMLLDDFIYMFKDDFYFLNKIDLFIIESLLKNSKYNKYLLCKKYIGNNKFINFFNNNYKKNVIYGFCKSLKKLAPSSNKIQQFIIDSNIKQLSVDKNFDQLFNILLELSLCNIKMFNIPYLFEDVDTYINEKKLLYKGDILTLKIATYNFYIAEWEMMIDNYYKKIEAVKIILN